MGIYYQVACDDLKERIDPGEVNGLCWIKESIIAHRAHPFGQLVVFAMLRRWCGHGVRIVNDSCADHQEAYESYRNVTGEVMKEYIEEYGTYATIHTDDGERPMKWVPDEYCEHEDKRVFEDKMVCWQCGLDWPKGG